MLGTVASFGHGELQGETLTGSRLSDEELDELRDLALRKRAFAKGRVNAEELTDTETARYEALVGRAAGDEALFERRRRHKAARAKLDELGEERRVSQLPRRRVFAEAGSIELPRYVFQWLLAESNRDGANWGVSEIGLLTVLLLSFENQTPILKDGRFVEKDGELTLVAPWGTGSEVKLVNRVEGSVHDGNGGIKVSASLVALARNNWLEVEQTVSEIRIQLGRTRRS